MKRIQLMGIGIIVLLVLGVGSTGYAQWTSAHPGMEWNSIMTGRTTGHIADLWLTNTTNQPQTVTVGPFYIPGPGQPYVTDGPHTISVPPNTTKTFPLDGSCTDRSKKPPKEGAQSDPETWLPPTDVSLPEPGAPMSSADGWEPGEEIENLVTIPKYPGYEVPFTYVMNKPSKHPEQIAPLLLEVSSLLHEGYEDLEMSGQIQTPVSLYSEKEEQVLVQLGIWQYASALQGDTYLMEDYLADAQQEYEDVTGKKYKDLPADEQLAFQQGIEDIWEASLDMGEEVRTINRPETYYSILGKKCNCDSLYLDADLVAQEFLEEEKKVATWDEELDFGILNTIKNKAVASSMIVVDPRSSMDLWGVVNRLYEEGDILIDPELVKIVDDVQRYDHLETRVFWLEEKMREFLKEKLGENEADKRMKANWDNLLFLNNDTKLKLMIRDVELLCHCNEWNPETKRWDPCTQIFGQISRANDKYTPMYPGELKIEIKRTKYTIGNNGKLTSASEQFINKRVQNGDYFHDFDLGDEPVEEFEIPLSFSEKGIATSTAKVEIRVIIEGRCFEDNCGGIKKAPKCKKLLYVEFDGISK
jgi:hypothetical protein